jgi:hypothetical protein
VKAFAIPLYKQWEVDFVGRLRIVSHIGNNLWGFENYK